MKKTQAKFAELRKKSRPDLIKQKQDTVDQLIKMRIQISLQKEKNTSKLKILRHDIAHIETLLHEEHHANT